MQEQSDAIESSRSKTETATASASTSQMTQFYYVISGVFVLVAVVFAVVGLYKLYDNTSDAQIVGGDAYNFIIYATRGTAFICAGIVCAVLSVTFAVFAHITLSPIYVQGVLRTGTAGRDKEKTSEM